MFAGSFFGRAYFAESYFGKEGGAVSPPAAAGNPLWPMWRNDEVVTSNSELVTSNSELVSKVDY